MRAIALGLLLGVCVAAAPVARNLIAPVRFEPNHGQARAETGYVGRGPGYSVRIAANAFELVSARGMRPHGFRVELRGANPEARLEALDPGASSTYHHSIRSAVPTFGRVAVRQAYPGIDIVYHSNASDLEYDFVLAAGADPNRIALVAPAGTSLRVSDDGDLLAGASSIRQKKPRAFQFLAGAHREVEARYELRADGSAGFLLGAYDRSQPLTIDPVVDVSTFAGMAGNGGRSLTFAEDSAGNTYVAGVGSAAIAHADPDRTDTDVFVAKYSPRGELLYSAYLGGSLDDFVTAAAIDSEGRLVLAGITGGDGLEPTLGAYRSAVRGEDDGWVARFDTLGRVEFLSILGGTGGDHANALTLDSAGDIYVAGQTVSADFPVTVEAEDAPTPGSSDAYVAKLSRDGRELLFSRRIGGPSADRALAIAVDPAGRIHVAGVTAGEFPTSEGAFSRTPAGGDDGFLVQLNLRGDRMRSSTLFGGSGHDIPYAMTFTPEGDVILAGSTNSPGFPGPNSDRHAKPLGGQDAFAIEFDSLGTTVQYATLLGDRGADSAYAVAADDFGNAYLTGVSSEFSPTPEVSGSPFVAKLSETGEVLSRTPLGESRSGAGTGVRVSKDRAVTVAGYFGELHSWNPLDNPETSTGGTFVARLELSEQACPLEVTPSSIEMGAEGGTVQVQVAAGASCTWRASSAESWIRIAEGGSGTANGTVTLTVGQAPAERRSVVLIGDQRVRISQAGGGVRPIPPPRVFTASQLYAVNGATPASGNHGAATLYTLDRNSGALLRTLGSVGHQVVGLAFHPSTGTLYGVTANQAASPRRLLTITISPTVSASLFPSETGAKLHDLAFDGAGNLYGWGGSHGGGERLFAVSTGTGLAAGRGATGVFREGAGLALSPTELYQADQVNAMLRFIDRGTGAASAGPVMSGSSDFRFTALETAPNGDLYGVTRPGTLQQFLSTTNLATINTGSGLISTRPSTGVTNISGIAFQVCTGTVSPLSLTAAVGGGSIAPAVSVTTGTGCVWAAVTNSNWLTVSAAGGTGSGSVTVTASANTGPPRTGSVTVAGETITVTQAGVANSCPVSVTPNPVNAPATAGSQTLTVTLDSICTWTSSTGASWLSFTGPTSGTGSGTVTLNYQANAGAARTGTVTVAGQTVTVNQQSPANACPTSIFPTKLTAGPSGSPAFTVAVTNAPGCTWVTANSTPWITLSTGGSGTGSGAVTFAIAANTGAARTGTINIAGQTLEVAQQPAGSPCFGTLSAAGSSVLPGTVTVNIQPGCAWSVANTVPWIVVINGSGTGSGSFTYSAFVNSGPPRSGSFTVAGQTFVVFQDGVYSTTLYGADGATRQGLPNSNLFLINPNTGGSLAIIGPTGQKTGGLAIHSITGDLYGVTTTLGANPQRLLRLNKQTGAATIVGPLGTNIREIAFDPAGNLYGWGAFQGNYDLYRIDTATGLATRIGESGIPDTIFGTALAFDFGGRLYYANQPIKSPNFYQVDTATGTLFSARTLTGSSDTKTVALDILPTGQLLALTHSAMHLSQVANLARIDQVTNTFVPVGRTVDYLNSIAALNCSGYLTPDKVQVPAAGGPYTAAIVISRPCDWTATPNAAWISIGQPSGKGTSALGFTAAANTGGPRSTTISIAGQSIAINQDGAVNGCPAVISPTQQTVTSAAGSLNVQVTVAAGCVWSAASIAAWITPGTTSPQTGSGTVALNFTANAGDPRTGTVNVAGQTFTLTQRSADNFCAATIQPTAQTIPPASGTATVTVTVAANCAWTASSPLPWATITSGATGAGNGSVVITATANPGPAARSGDIAIAGKVFTLTQASPVNFCPATLNPASQQAIAGGGSFQVNFTVAAGCQWSVVPGLPFVTVTSATSGTGSSTVSYTVAANTGYARSTTLTIAGQPFKISQAGPLNGTLYAVNGGGGSANSRLLRIEPSTGNLVADVGAIGFPVNGLAFHPVTRQLYGTTNRQGVPNIRKLLRIDPNTAAATVIGDLLLPEGSLHDLAFDPSGELYGTSSLRDSNDLYRVNIANAALTKMGPGYPDPISGNASAFAPDGTLYVGHLAGGFPNGANDPRNFLLKLNPANGAPTFHAMLTGRAANEKFSAFDFDPYGTMYGLVLPQRFATPSNLVTVNTSTGVITTVGAAPDSVNAIAFYPTVCAFYATPSRVTIPLSGGFTNVEITGAPECGWNVSGVPTWLQPDATAGNGNRAVRFTATATTVSRSATVQVAGKTIQITQTNGTAALARSVGIFRSGFYWLLDVNGDLQFSPANDRAFGFGGIPGDIPITGDWNGDGRTKVGIYRPVNGLFVLDFDGDNQFTAADRAYNLGVGIQAADVPVVGDWNGDGRTKVGLFRQGYFWILDTNGNGAFDGSDQTIAFGGVPGDKPLVGDWNGDGRSKIGLFRLGFFWLLDVNGNAVLDNVNGPGGDRAFPFGGLAGDVPMVADWNGDGTSKPGLFRFGFFWVVDLNGNYQFEGTGPGQDRAFPFGGIPGDIAVTGKW